MSIAFMGITLLLRSYVEKDFRNPEEMWVKRWNEKPPRLGKYGSLDDFTIFGNGSLVASCKPIKVEVGHEPGKDRYLPVAIDRLVQELSINPFAATATIIVLDALSLSDGVSTRESSELELWRGIEEEVRAT